MKKFTAIIVMTAMLCSFTACGNDVADEITEESSVSSVAEVSEEETTTEEITESETTEEVDDNEEEEISETETEYENEQSGNAQDYKEALETFLECINSHDIDGMMKLSYPDKYIDVIRFMGEDSGYSIEEVMNYEDDGEETVRLAEIISEESASDYDIEVFHEYYGEFQLIRNYLDETGTDNFDYDAWWEWVDTINIEDVPEPYFYTDDIRLVNCLLEYTDSDGDTYTEAQDFIMYYIDGEGWKIDMSMFGYTKKSKKQSILSTADTIKKSSNSALSELDEIDVQPPEKCIICSDSSKNYNVTDDFVSQFEEALGLFFNIYDEYDYIIVLNEDNCVYVACKDPEFPKYIGTYPAESIYSAENGVSDMDREYTFDEIYNLCLEEIQK
ncbi:MAG: hypothetical protein NC177_01030 [Ruminococcus flavefaciens]|nr:hypothetical protein [Ruminococcus flavefaciens]